ncbi:MAG: hypothetical protein CL569_11550 [Alphaproteobacteria bacterium]|nr:hypothetical protein [Alphaproteobacteria bacterium]
MEPCVSEFLLVAGVKRAGISSACACWFRDCAPLMTSLMGGREYLVIRDTIGRGYHAQTLEYGRKG